MDHVSLTALTKLPARNRLPHAFLDDARRRSTGSLGRSVWPVA